MLLRPISWSVNVTGNYDCIAYTESGKLTLLQVAAGITQAIRFNEEPTQQEISNLLTHTKPISYSLSKIDNRVIILRSPATKVTSQTGWTVKNDPIDSLTSYFSSAPFQPYSWLKVKQYTVGSQGKTDVDVMANERDIEQGTLTIKPKRKVMLWAVEPTIDQTSIQMITVGIARDWGLKTFVYSREPVNVSSQVVAKQFKSEADLISGFLSLWSIEKPDVVVTYDGDCFEFPLLFNRLSALGINLTSLSRIRDATVTFTPTSLKIPGVEVIDLVHFLERFYPAIYDFKLSTVTEYLLSESLTDEEGLADYCVRQVWAMEKMYRILDVESTIESKANLWRTTLCNIVDQPDENLVNIIAHSIDQSVIFLTGCSVEMTHITNGERGFYSNVYSYDYTKLYQQLMLMSPDYLTSSLGTVLADAPPSLLATTYFSKYAKRGMLEKYLDQLLNVGQVIEITPTIIRCLKIIKSNVLVLENINPVYAILDGSSRIVYDTHGFAHGSMTGTDPLVTANFPLAVDMILTYAGNLALGHELTQINLSSYPLSKFILTSQIRPASEEKPGSDAALLALQYATPISTTVKVEYLKTTSGPRLRSLFRPNVHTLDYRYYSDRLNSYIQQLLDIPLFK